VVAYANDVKRRLLKVPATLLARHGAVSKPVAARMARGVRSALRAKYGVAITGIAGPGGGSAAKPVGLVYVAAAGPRTCRVRRCRLSGGRAAVRRGACRAALELLDEMLTTEQE
jgi:nicotinamide-nucleotide amidase